MARRRLATVRPSPEVTIDRSAGPGRHRLLDVFRGLERVPPFVGYPAGPAVRRAVARATDVQVIPGPTWMYVAPHEVPSFAKDVGWSPFTSRTDCIVVGRRHLARSAAITVYLDILHELYHIFQRRAGRELWDIERGYADSPTEIEAYRFAIAEARRLGASEAYLREYLRVEWINAREYARLVRNAGVAPRGNVPPA
ncbi:MAG TPA: hypothetical protein VMG36_08415 [Thermoplasmata archaeon]|nr:hypothetical protein [Thermoplasmata archaeon]